CASLEAEEFSLEQSGRYCSAIEIDEGPACSGSMTVEVCREESFAGTRLSLEQHHWQPPSARQLSEQPVNLLTYHLRCVAFTEKGDHGSQPLLCLLFGPCGAESERPRFDDVAYPPPSSVLGNRNRPSRTILTRGRQSTVTSIVKMQAESALPFIPKGGLYLAGGRPRFPSAASLGHGCKEPADGGVDCLRPRGLQRPSGGEAPHLPNEEVARPPGVPRPGAGPGIRAGAPGGPPLGRQQRRGGSP